MFLKLLIVLTCLGGGSAWISSGPGYHTSARRTCRAASTQISVGSIDSASIGNKKSATERISVLVCPAQFCVPIDYDPLYDNLKELESQGELSKTIGAFRVAPLPRTEWIKVARQLPTKAFLEGRLPVLETLGWYFDAIDQAVAEILAEEGPHAKISIVGHSIGGWVARAYLGGLSQSSTAAHRLAVNQVASLVTIGTPHVSPDAALVDQTRGLLQAIASTPSCSPQALCDRGIDMTCVCSDALVGQLLTTNAEELIAVASYLPLLGRFDAAGDGIVPLDLAFMDEPARRVIVRNCERTKQPVRHAHIVPTPWNLWDGYAPSIKLPGERFPSYIAPGVLSQWAQYI